MSELIDITLVAKHDYKLLVSLLSAEACHLRGVGKVHEV